MAITRYSNHQRPSIYPQPRHQSPVARVLPVQRLDQSIHSIARRGPLPVAHRCVTTACVTYVGTTAACVTYVGTYTGRHETMAWPGADGSAAGADCRPRGLLKPGDGVRREKMAARVRVRLITSIGRQVAAKHPAAVARGVADAVAVAVDYCFLVIHKPTYINPNPCQHSSHHLATPERVVISTFSY